MADRTLTVKIVGDERDLLRSLKKSSAAANKFSKDATQAGKAPVAAAGGARSVAKLGAAYFGTQGLIAGLTASVKAGSDLNEMISQTNVVFGSSAQEVLDWSKSTATAFGISRREALKTAAGFGALFTPLGVVGDEAAEQSRQLTQLGADLASFYNTDVASALDAIRSGLVGESEPLRRYGVLLSETRVQQQALADTGKKTAKNLTDQEKVFARIKIILKDSAVAQGDFARTSDGAAGKAKILKANIGDLSADLGRLLLPAVIDVTDAMVRFSITVQSLNDEGFKGFGKKLVEGLSSKELLKFLVAGPFFDSMTNAFGLGGKKAGEAFIAGFNSELQPQKINTAGVEGIITFFKKQLAKRFGTGTPFLDLGQAQAEATKKLTDDLAVSLRRIVVLRERLSKATGLKEQTDLQNAVNAERDRAEAIRDQIRARKESVREAAKERRERAREAAQEAARKAKAARERAKTKRDARQFGLLGLGPTGGEKIPGVKGLRKSLGAISEAVKGTFLDTGKTRSLLANIRKILAGGLGKVSAEVRAAIKNILDDIDKQLKDHTAKGNRTKFRVMSTAQLVAGLGLTREQALAVRQRAARRGPGGTIPNTGPAAFGFAVPQPGARRRRGAGGGRGPDAAARPIQVNLVVSGKKIAQVILPEFQRMAERSASSSRGRFGGKNLGAA